MRLWAAIIALCVLAGVVGGARPASAATWTQPIVRIEDHTGDSRWAVAIMRAAWVWDIVSPKVKFSYSTGSGPCAPNANVVSICISDDAHTHGWNGWTEMVNPTGTIDWAYVLFKPNDWRIPARQSLACHELGHVLGLGHSSAVTSCMEVSGGGTYPDLGDVFLLGALYSSGPARL